MFFAIFVRDVCFFIFMPMKIHRFFFLIFMLIVEQLCSAQEPITITGKVTDADNGRAMYAVSIMADDGHTGTVTNEDGLFMLKLPASTQTINFSHLGYKTRSITLPQKPVFLKIKLKPTTVILKEVLVADPETVLKTAIRNIPVNYSSRPLSQQCFYRETTRKGKRYIYVAEAITDMYKRSYAHGVTNDKVAIRKARRLISTQSSDTLGAKIAGGPTIPIYLDIVKNLDYLLNDKQLALYQFSMMPSPSDNNNAQVVVRIEPKYVTEYALLWGDFYINTETYAIKHVDLQLDMRDRNKATKFMLKSKPIGVRFTPRSLTIHINYQENAFGQLSLNYIRTDTDFKCEWKRKLFASPYRVTSEMVVTHEAPDAFMTIKGRDAFRKHEALYDHPEYFGDPEFWEQYNIIAPTERLEKGIERFIKKNNKH